MSNPAILLDTQQVPVHVDFYDAEGSPSAVTPLLTVTDPTVLALTVITPDGLTTSLDAVVASTGKVGVATLEISATNPDGTSLSASQDFQVAGGDVASIKVTLGTPVPIVLPTPVPTPTV